MFFSPAPPISAGPAHPLLHIPDGFLSVVISIVCWLLSAALLATAARRSQGELGERMIPLAGVMAAFIFAAQMINFPVAFGTSGHLLGGALAAIVLGPWVAMLVMASVVGVQALLFQDGGLLALGANILNMGILTAAIGYGLYRGAAGRSPRFKLGVAGVAAWLSVMGGALATSLQLWLSGTSSLQLVIPAMLGVHALIGLGEALITVAALAFVGQTRPDLLQVASARAGRGWIAAGFAVALGVVLLSPLASANPDGLERVAMNMGFIDAGQSAPYNILPDYTVPFIENAAMTTILSGIIGALLVGALAVAAVRLVQRRRMSPG
jgi:cobalt/nickel transport system permease protein